MIVCSRWDFTGEHGGDLVRVAIGEAALFLYSESVETGCHKRSSSGRTKAHTMRADGFHMSSNQTSDENPDLPIHDMHIQHYGLTKSIAASHLEAAGVCLDRHHESPMTFVIQGSEQRMDATVSWESTDDRTKGAWANEIDTTEDGAYACVIAAVELLCGLLTIRRSPTETGADYYVACPGASIQDLEGYIRLEVSGVNGGNPSVVARRLRDKLRQASRGKSNLPAIAGVVGFHAQLIRLARLEE